MPWLAASTPELPTCLTAQQHTAAAASWRLYCSCSNSYCCSDGARSPLAQQRPDESCEPVRRWRARGQLGVREARRCGATALFEHTRPPRAAAPQTVRRNPVCAQSDRGRGPPVLPPAPPLPLARPRPRRQAAALRTARQTFPSIAELVPTPRCTVRRVAIATTSSELPRFVRDSSGPRPVTRHQRTHQSLQNSTRSTARTLARALPYLSGSVPNYTGGSS
jgi:hypothetical protein